MPNAAESSCHSVPKTSKEWGGKGWVRVVLSAFRTKWLDCLKHNKTTVFMHF